MQMMEMNTQTIQAGQQDLAVFTVCNIAYLPKALVLADSLLEHQQTRLKVIVFDKKQDLIPYPDAVEIIWVEELGLAEWKKLAFTYDIIEFSTSLKPYIALKLLEKHKRVIFLDPDTAVFSSLEPILKDLDASPVVLTPHYTKPQPDTENESDLGMMRFGSFNLGFFAVRQGKDAISFLQWWNRRCIDFCFMESQFGLSTDQKWVSIAPCFFDFLKISFNPGYNAAAWNTFERTLTGKVGRQYMVNHEYPLVFFHFSNFDHADPQYLNKRASSERGKRYDLLDELGSEYSRKLQFYENTIKRTAYSFDYMSDGSYISPTLRRAFVSVRHLLPSGADPFDSNGPVGSFARENRLILPNAQERYSYPGLRHAQDNKKMLGFIYLIMRFAQRILGPNRFYDLSKLMVYLSIYRMQSKYWKLNSIVKNK
jgi:hypothetical protein